MDMVIGIDASRAFLKKRTGIEEYSYQVIKHLRAELAQERVVLYVRKKARWQGGGFVWEGPEIDFSIPENWSVKALWAPRFWTQLRLSLEMLLHAPDVLFVPAHTVPLIHPKRTVVTIHGLEYEFCPRAYSWYERFYMRISIWCSCQWAKRIICVSENTRRDVMRLYDVPASKTAVISEGYEMGSLTQSESRGEGGFATRSKPYLLFIGRLEERKNVVRIIQAFEILKARYQIAHELLLVGRPGYGFARIERAIAHSPVASDIVSLGYVSEEEKWTLLRGADVLVFPSLYEGFGIPVLEAQAVGTPVVTSHLSSLPEVAGEGAVLVNPFDAQSIAEGTESLVADTELRNAIIKKATQNVSRFGWAACAREIAAIIDCGSGANS